MTPEQHIQLEHAIAQLLPDWEGDALTPQVLTRAASEAKRHHDVRHHVLHRYAQLGGAVVWGMRQRGMSWRAIYDATGIVQRTAARWLDLFLAEGIDERPPAELDQRWMGPADEGTESND